MRALERGYLLGVYTNLSFYCGECDYSREYTNRDRVRTDEHK